jgi:BirA family biotin operon repressor/biotin-[acetyl-CoA-carboxylase] ligase
MEYLGTVESTQTVAKRRAKALVLSDQPLGFPREFYVAEAQTHGRGQHGRQWSSPLGGLYLSAVVPDVPQYMHRYLPLITGLAVARMLLHPWFPAPWLPGKPALETAFHDVRLRWPNDVLVHDRKIAGVLSESVTIGHRAVAVIGVGMNVNADPAEANPELAASATSIARELGRMVDLVRVNNAVLHNINESINALAAGRWPRQHKDICDLDFLHGRNVEIALDTQRITGTGAGIADDGALLLKTSSGERKIYSGTIITIDNKPIRPPPP